MKDLCTSFDRQAFLEGHLSPVYFGSALKNFGVRDLLEALIAYAPPPRDQQAAARVVHATEPKMTGIVFKIQANMDPNHRDRIAFMRLASGKLTRGMKVKLVRTGKTVALNAPQFFFAQDRSIADEAYAGDVVGIPNHGLLRIGDTLTEGEDVVFTGVPSFAPEILRRVKLGDPMKAKKLREALEQLAEEGVVQLFIPADGSPAIVGVVGALQLDVLADRLANEYGVPVSFEPSRYEVMRWISCDDRKKLDEFIAANRFSIANDLDGDPVFMAQSAFSLNYTLERAPEIRTTEIKEMHKAAMSTLAGLSAATISASPHAAAIVLIFALWGFYTPILGCIGRGSLNSQLHAVRLRWLQMHQGIDARAPRLRRDPARPHLELHLLFRLGHAAGAGGPRRRAGQRQQRLPPHAQPRLHRPHHVAAALHALRLPARRRSSRSASSPSPMRCARWPIPSPCSAACRPRGRISPEARVMGEQSAVVLTEAVRSINTGIRGYYYAVAATVPVRRPLRLHRRDAGDHRAALSTASCSRRRRWRSRSMWMC